MLLIVLGVFFLVTRIVPGFLDTFSWPFVVIGVGAIFLVLALVTWTPGLAVPAFIIGGIGMPPVLDEPHRGVVALVVRLGLIPGFVGVGVAVNELLEGRPLRALVEGGWPILISLLLFFLFGSFFGGLSWQGPWWAIVLIAIGVLVILRPLVRKGTAGKRRTDMRRWSFVAGAILILLGALAILNAVLGVTLHLFWPIILIAVGVWIIFGVSRGRSAARSPRAGFRTPGRCARCRRDRPPRRRAGSPWVQGRAGSSFSPARSAEASTCRAARTGDGSWWT